MEKIHLDSCPICGCGNLKPACRAVDHFSSKEEFEVDICPECGFMMTQDAPSEEEIGQYYESPEYISHSNTGRGLVNSLYHLVRSYMLRRKLRLIERESFLRTGHLLDIGAGTGYFAHHAAKAGWKTEALEKSPAAREFAKRRFGIEMIAEEEIKTLRDNSFDVVTMWHVMEHVRDLDKLWSELRRILKEDGVLIVAVPNTGSYDFKKYGHGWAALDVPRHLWHFNASVMQKLSNTRGFKMSDCYAMPFDAFYISAMSEKNAGHNCSFIRGMWTGLMARLHTMAHKEEASSLIYVFRKK